jgi:O-succinylbenzoate synthase
LVAVKTVRFRIPLHVPFRGISARDGFFVEGDHGWGECSPFPGFPIDAEAAMRAAREFADEEAPPLIRDVIPVHATIPAVDAETAHRMVRESGCATAKVKVAEGDDEVRLAAVRDALGARGRIRIDANGAWDVEMAVREIRRLGRYGLELVEQPAATVEELAELRARVDVPIAADESVAEYQRVVALNAADALVLKVQAIGGVRAGLRIAEETGLPCIVSSMIETSVGLSAGVALAAALPELPFACGLATIDLLDGDVVRDPLRARNGLIDVRRPQVDEELLRRYEVTDA